MPELKDLEVDSTVRLANGDSVPVTVEFNLKFNIGHHKFDGKFRYFSTLSSDIIIGAIKNFSKRHSS